MLYYSAINHPADGHCLNWEILKDSPWVRSIARASTRHNGGLVVASSTVGRNMPAKIRIKSKTAFFNSLLSISSLNKDNAASKNGHLLDDLNED